MKIHAIRILLGIFFVASGLAKLLDTHAFVTMAQRYTIDEIAVFAVVFPPAEFVLGLLLLSGHGTYMAAQTVVTFTLFVTALYTIGLVALGITDCGCFGTLKFMDLPPWGLYLRNALLIGSGWWLALATPKPAVGAERVRQVDTAWLTAIALLGATAFLLAGISYRGPIVHGTVSVRQWGGEPVSQTPFADLLFPGDSTYALYLFKPDCPLCKDMAANAASWREAGLVDEIIAITAAGYNNAVADSAYRARFGRYFDRIGYLSNTKMKEATDYVPTLVIIQNDTIRHVQTGSIPSGFRVQRTVEAHPATIDTASGPAKRRVKPAAFDNDT